MSERRELRMGGGGRRGGGGGKKVWYLRGNGIREMEYKESELLKGFM